MLSITLLALILVFGFLLAIKMAGSSRHGYAVPVGPIRVRYEPVRLVSQATPPFGRSLVPLLHHPSGELLARAVVGTLFTLLSINLFGDFVRTGRVTALFLLGNESLVVMLTVFRRRARGVDHSVGAVAATALCVAGPLFLRATDTVGLVPDTLTATVSMMGLALVVVSKLSLGRSFGLIPANRGIVVRGPYTRVRHPIYTGYMITYAAFLVAHPEPRNAIVISLAVAALVVRALLEERVLGADVEYQAYRRRVVWQFVPTLI